IGIVDGTSSSTITSNVIMGNKNGIRLGWDENAFGNQDNNIICSNTILRNLANGILIQSGSNNVIGDATGTCANTIQNNSVNGLNLINGNSTQNRIRRNSISCNGLTQPLVSGVRSVYGINLNLNAGNNANISITPAFVYPPYVVSTLGIQFPNTPTTQGSGPAVSASDIIEVFYDPCGTCQGQTYLGNATLSISGSTLYWSFPAGSIPTAAFCSTTLPAGTCPSGIINISATRTNSAGNTSQFMPCSGVQVLPVTFLEVDAKVFQNFVKVEWVTANESNNSHYEIERSLDGVSYIRIGTVKGATNSGIPLSYFFNDNSPVKGVSYYRIKQVDLNGSFTYSKVVSVLIGGISVDIYPNPTDGMVNLGINSSSGNQIVDVSVYNALA
ncbi:MAG: hypothetical protein K2Q22_00980, partial [Cytophagales bacterium]|nr:hypothetical protein [Cytophagales bacterium]